MIRTDEDGEDVGRRGSQDTMTTSSVTSSPSDYSRNSGMSTAATSIASSPGDSALPLKMKGLSLRKVEEMGSGEALREGFDLRVYGKGEIEQRREFQRRIDLALSEVEKLALEESDGEGSDGENEVLAPRAMRAM
jgi:hypothetical protein